MNKIGFLLCNFLLMGGPVAHAATTCSYDKAALLALDEEAFDQDPSGGWRTVAKTPGCELAAADLLNAYRTKHSKVSAVLAWHEGQLRAMAGQYERAIPLLNKDRKPPGQDPAGWNYYVDATLAFLRHDKPALLNARQQLAAVPYAEGMGLPPLKNGYFEIPGQPGHPATRMRWPPNIDVVDGLVACFGKSYSEADGKACRPPSP
ncbi:hypothetical protein [Novilysobacter antarcticus]|uniref:hypothetical protein n=1 Tax=Novilysobacter antarcticus TaxID=2862543 RepID=UPI001FE432D4|nr:hypothetical protein [Lysobacter antarcticus]